MREITGNFKMKFIGRPEGKLMKGAPGNYTHGETYNVPYHWSEWPYWELVGEKPTVQVPDAGEGDTIFETPPIVPEEKTPPSTPMIGLTTEEGYQKNLQKLERGDYTVSGTGIIDYSSEEEKPEYTRKELKKALDDAGVEYNPRTRTFNLRKMVEELDEAEK